jgi:hypothetical protein
MVSDQTSNQAHCFWQKDEERKAREEICQMCLSGSNTALSPRKDEFCDKKSLRLLLQIFCIVMDGLP